MELPGLGLNSAASSRKTLNFQSSCLSQASSFDEAWATWPGLEGGCGLSLPRDWNWDGL